MVGTRNVSGRYEIYANGVRIGGLGDFTGSRLVNQNAMLAFAVPDKVIAQRRDPSVAAATEG